MARPALEVADIFRDHGAAWRHANRGHVSLLQLKVMSAIESCRTAALGGHVARCEDCAHTTIAYNSCRNRHCPKCQGAAAHEWMAAREADLLPIPYFHVVFTLPSAIGDIAYQNKAAIYDLLFKASSEAMLTIAADPKHLGARIGITSVLHTWGSAMTHHPHVHMIVPGGGLSMDASRWISCKPNFLLPVRVLSKLFRRLMLEKLVAAHQAGKLQFFGSHAQLADAKAFAAFLAPLRKKRWFVYAKRPFAGPKAVLAYLSRYTHRVAISNSRLIAVDQRRLVRQRQSRRDDRAGARAPGAGRACGRDRSVDRTAARPPLPLLRRPHDHHRDLRGRLPAAPSSEPASCRNQNRHVMSTTTASNTRSADPVSRWPLPGHASARPNRSPASLPVSRSSPKAIIMGAQANPTRPTNKRNHPIATLQNLAPALIAAIKSP
jgi:hypothetical protein